MKIIRTFLASVLLWIIFWAFSVDAAEVRKMIVPYTPLTGASTPFWIAIEEKLFQKYGLEIGPLFISGGSSAIVPAMTAGQFDIGAVGGGAVVLNRFSGGDLITIGAQTGVYTTDCFAKPEIKSIRDLRGRTIAVTRFGTSTHFAGLSMLRLGGLKPTDVVFIQIGGSSEAIAGLSSGRVDAAMLGYPASDVALKKGFRQLTDLAKNENGAFPTTAIAARESWLKDPKNREGALNFLRAFTDGLSSAEQTLLLAGGCCVSTPESTTRPCCRPPLNTTSNTSVTRLRSTREATQTCCNSSIIPKPRMLIRSASSTTACSNRCVANKSDPKLSVLGGSNHETHRGIAGIGFVIQHLLSLPGQGGGSP